MDSYIKTAEDAARRAGAFILDNLGKLKGGDVNEKGSADFVTRVDKESEAMLVESLRGAFPDHGIMAEESEEEKSGSGYTWIIDPLDGTTNYIHGYPAFSVSVALRKEGEIIAGVVYDPLRDELFSGGRGRGAWLWNSGLRLAASGRTDPRGCLLATGFPFKSHEWLDDYLEMFKGIFLKSSGIRRGGSAALDLSYLAAGRVDGFFELGLKPWDMAAGVLLVEEAGGVVSDFGGGRNFLETGNIVAAATKDVHESMLEEVRKVFTGRLDK